MFKKKTKTLEIINIIDKRIERNLEREIMAYLKQSLCAFRLSQEIKINDRYVHICFTVKNENRNDGVYEKNEKTYYYEFDNLYQLAFNINDVYEDLRQKIKP